MTAFCRSRWKRSRPERVSAPKRQSASGHGEPANDHAPDRNRTAGAQAPASSGPDHRSGPTRGRSQRRCEGRGQRVAHAGELIQTNARPASRMGRRLADQPTGPNTAADYLNGHQRRRAASLSAIARHASACASARSRARSAASARVSATAARRSASVRRSRNSATISTCAITCASALSRTLCAPCAAHHSAKSSGAMRHPFRLSRFALSLRDLIARRIDQRDTPATCAACAGDMCVALCALIVRNSARTVAQADTS